MIEDNYEAYLTALDALSTIQVIGPSVFSTMNDWPLPALTVDVEGMPIGSLSENIADADAQGLIMPHVIHIPINETNFRAMVRDTMTLFRQILQTILAQFPPSMWNLRIDDMWNYVVPFGSGQAFGSGFSITASLI